MTTLNSFGALSPGPSASKPMTVVPGSEVEDDRATLRLGAVQHAAASVRCPPLGRVPAADEALRDDMAARRLYPPIPAAGSAHAAHAAVTGRALALTQRRPNGYRSRSTPGPCAIPIGASRRRDHRIIEN
jgi:hypothetical protein